jgi:hypothetical protein
LATPEYCEVTYLYRDASNYKFLSSFKVRGRLEVADLQDHMFDQGYFVPYRVGIPMLTPGQRNEDDHDLHEIVSIEPAKRGRYLCTATELAAAFRRENRLGWFR